MSFLKLATPLVDQNVPVIRLRPRTKIAFDPDWPALATTGQILFNKDRTRTTTNKKTKLGTEFMGKLAITEKEFKEVCQQVQHIFPPVKTTFNGKEIPARKPLHSFSHKLPTEIADDRGITRLRQRVTEVRLYEPLGGEKATIYEKGLPVVEIEGKWHVDIQQKIPLSIERDKVTPSYLKSVHVAVLNEMHERLSEKDGSAAWVRLDDARLKPEAVRTIANKKYGEEAVVEDRNDEGSSVEATVHNKNVVPRGAVSSAELKNIRSKTGLLKKAGDVFPTNFRDTSTSVVPPEEYGDDLKRFVKLIENVSPHIIPHKVTVKVIDDPKVKCLGCTHWEKDTYIFKINLAYQDVSDFTDNISLLIHEISHHSVQNNNHGGRDFWESTTMIGAKLALVAADRPELFGHVSTPTVVKKAA